MSSDSLNLQKLNEEDLEKDSPLSDEEISRLIQASRETSFKRKEIKKEMTEAFKKVSLHDIAKKYNKDIFPKKELDEDSNQQASEDQSIKEKDSKESKENKKEDEIENKNNIENDKKIVMRKNKIFLDILKYTL